MPHSTHTHTHTHICLQHATRAPEERPHPLALCLLIAPCPIVLFLGIEHHKIARLQRVRAQERTPSGPRSASTRASSRRTARRRALSRRRVGGGAWEEAGEEARALVARTPRHHQADESTTRGPGEHGSFPGQVGTGGGFHDQTHAARGARGARAAFLVRGAGGGSHVTVRHRHVTSVQRQVRPSVLRPPPSRAYVRTSPSPPPPAPLAPWPAACARA